MLIKMNSTWIKMRRYMRERERRGRKEKERFD